MTAYVLRRVIQLVFVFFGVTALIYAAVWVLPGDPIRALAAGREISESTINALRDKYNLNDPLPLQYVKYLGGLITGNLGIDLSGRPIADELARRWPVTITLALTALGFQAIFGVLFGTWAAVRKDKLVDRTVLVSTLVFISIPAFVLAYLVQLAVGVKWGILPAAGISAGWPRSYLLPALVLAAAGLATITRLVRTNVIENLESDYARTARAKGARPSRVLLHHVLRTSLIPTITVLGIELGYLLTGAIIVEGIFNLPGVGQLLFQSVLRQDGLVVVSVASIIILIFLVTNLLVDLLYGALDPRIRHGR